MNRIILIGNGFDLAHEMETSYQDFIDDYWKNAISEIKESKIRGKFENDEFNIQRSPGKYIVANNYKSLKKSLKSHKTDIECKNRFLEKITEKGFIENWVDVESEYYSLLKKAFDKTRFPRHNYDVKNLNLDFEKIKNLLAKYLQSVQSKYTQSPPSEFNRTKKIIGNKIFHPFKLKDFSEDLLNQKAELEYKFVKKELEDIANSNKKLEDISKIKRNLVEKVAVSSNSDQYLSEIKKLLQSFNASTYFDLIPDQTLFLNFNYTITDNAYINAREFDQFDGKKFSSTKSIRIHGTLQEHDNNPMIFGFGDEIDDDYKQIEKLNDNRYLENIKSINYLESDNYKKLLEFINGSAYQIFIFGHSCGISDRTLLNTIFEHDNCGSIKPFYHQINESADNYSDIVRNISRNFNDKAKMRDRVVNKNYCEPLVNL